MEHTEATASPETAARLKILAYHPRHSSNPDTTLRFAREFLGRDDLTHQTLLLLGEADALRLIEALERRFPDKRAGTAAKVTRTMLDRP
jgi:hypothetical protein